MLLGSVYYMFLLLKICEHAHGVTVGPVIH
jgi:hypothetical protein